MKTFELILLGVVQGLTEFLPISSDGHLQVLQIAMARLAGREVSGAKNLFITVMLHLGTLAAILVYHHRVVARAVRGLFAGGGGFPRAEVIKAGVLAIVATSPLVPDQLIFGELFERASGSLIASAAGFLVTAAVLAITPRIGAGTKGLAETTWVDALLIGLAQAVAPMPGVSRSGVTIAAALGLGFSRTWAVGFSLLIAVPAIAGAVVLKLKDAAASDFAGVPIVGLMIGTIVAGVVGFGAIVWLVRVVRSGRLWYFSVYLVVLAGLILATLP